VSPARSSGQVRIGISGWRYAGWRGKFYPPKLAQRRELAFASQAFSTIEINGTFYSLQRPDSFQQWFDETPADFVFSVKGSRFITHMKKLRGIDEALANYFAQGLLRLGAKLGPILWQFPPNLTYDRERFNAFFDQLPRTTNAAASIAASHGPRLQGRAWIETDKNRPLLHCVEVRHESFVDPDFIALLRRQKISLVVADTVEWPLLLDVTSDFVYCRLHGSQELYSSGYDARSLDVWAERINGWTEGTQSVEKEAPAENPARYASAVRAKQKRRDVYVYFDNDAKVRAPVDARGLRQRVAKTLGSSRVPGATEANED
jgi:uncharacterized protein YecE (DUF72 family)